MTPWYDKDSDPEFWQMLETARSAGQYIVSPECSYMVHQFCRSCLHLDGDIAECGVYTGGIAHLMAQLAAGEADPPSLHLFDTFEGMPDSAIPERDYFAPGDLSASLDDVRHRLRGFPFVQFHPGVIPHTFIEVARVDAYSFVHVNVDIYPATLECCKWFWPRLRTGGILFVGDYGFRVYRRAARAAVDEFFNQVSERPVVLPTGQALIIKR